MPLRVVDPTKMTNAVMTAQYQREAEIASPTPEAMDAAIIACSAMRVVGAHWLHGTQRRPRTFGSFVLACLGVRVRALGTSIERARERSMRRSRTCAITLRATR